MECVLEMISISVFRAGSKPLPGERVCCGVEGFHCKFSTYIALFAVTAHRYLFDSTKHMG